MKLSLWVVVLTLHGCLLSQLVWAGISAYVAKVGVVTLGDATTDPAREDLIEMPGEVAGMTETARPTRVSKAARRYAPIVDRVARDHGIESALLHAVISVESRYDSNALSPAGASGLMQLMPATAKHYGVADPFDPEQNMQGGARYLRYLLDKFDRDIGLALAAYNAGETAVYKHGNRIPPYRETTDYVHRVLAIYRVENDAPTVARLSLGY